VCKDTGAVISGRYSTILGLRASKGGKRTKEKMARIPGINKVNWHQIGSVTKPGRYQYTFGWLTVEAEDISIWTRFSNAVFTLVNVRTTEDQDGEEYRLGTVELR